MSSLQAFKRDFKDVVTKLGSSAYFTPYYVIYDGSSYGCSGVSAGICTESELYVRSVDMASSFSVKQEECPTVLNQVGTLLESSPQVMHGYIADMYTN